MSPNLIHSQEELYEIHFQSPPNLGTELTKVFQDVIDFRDESKKKMRGSKLVKFVIEKFKTKYAKELAQVIKKYTGLNAVIKLEKRPVLNWGATFHLGEYDLVTGRLKEGRLPITWAIEARACGQVPAAIYEKWAQNYADIKTQEELVKLSKSIVLNKAAMRAGLFEKHGLEFELWLCPYGSFFIPELLGSGFPNLTAEELASIICHECGHVISFILHAQDLCYKKQILYDGAKKATENFSKQSQNQIKAAAIAKAFPQQAKRFNEKTKEILKNCSGSKKNDMGDVIGSFLMMVWKTMWVIPYIGLRVIGEALRPMFCGIKEHARSYEKDGKTSDFFSELSAGGYYWEECADEYVSKMGFTHYHAVAESKMAKWFRYIGSKGFKSGSKVDFFFRLLPWMAYSLFKGYAEDYVHPDQYQREMNALMDIIKAFKSNNVDPEQLNAYYEAFKIVKDLVENNEFERRWEKANKAIRNSFEYIITTPYAMLISGRFQEEYERLWKQVRQLMHNQLYALSYGLKQKAESQNNETINH